MKFFLKTIVCALFFSAFAAQAQTKPIIEGRWVIYYASWDEWGHLPDCKGWGLCNFQDCWFCDVPDKHPGKVIVDKDTRKGHLVIELDPKDPIQMDAITKKLVFTVSKDINNKNALLYKGKYAFDAQVGKDGGYKIDILVK